jgi:nuclear-control-of-ATPase protein 2
MVKLILVQVQQLKVGMLSTLDTIDVLMKGSHTHFQILAAIPAIVMAMYGTKYFFRVLPSIRAKDLRPMRSIHGEMVNCISAIECLIILSDQNCDHRDTATQLKPSEIGEIVLNVYN